MSDVTSNLALTPRMSRPRRIRAGIEALAVDYGVLATAVGLGVFFTVKSPYFLTTANLLNIGNFAAATGIIAVAFTIALIAGHVDVSFAASYTLSNVAIGRITESYHQSVGVAILAAFAICGLVALSNGILVVQFGLPTIVATIATAAVGTSVAALWVNGQLIFLAGRAHPLTGTIRAKVAGVPVPMIFLLIAFVLGWLFLTRTRVGWHIYASGGNPSAALRTGVSVAGITYLVFFIMALAAGAASIIDTGRLGFSDGGQTATTEVLAASLMGGAGLAGGTGKVEKTIFGVILVSVLANGLTLLNVDEYMVFFWTAVVLLLAVAWAGLATRRGVR